MRLEESRIRRRNFGFLLFEGTFFFTGMAFLDSNSVVPVFMDTYTGSLQLAGLAVALRTASSLLAQLLVGPRVPGIRNIPSFIVKVMLLCRPLPLLMIPILFSGMSSYGIALVFLVMFSLLWLSDGIVVVPWLDLFARTIPVKKRGKLFGYQQIFGGLGSLAAGAVIKLSLESAHLTSAGKYSIIFGMGGLTLLLSSFAMLFARDLPRKAQEERVDFIRYFRVLPGYLSKNPLYRQMILVRILSAFSTMIFPFVILFGKHIFALNPVQISNLIYVQIAGGLAGGFFWGFVSHRFGNRQVILLSQIFCILLPLLAFVCLFLAPYGVPMALLWAMAILTGMAMGSWMGFVNYTMDVVGEEERPVYFVLTSVITFPFTFVPYLAGITADHWGFVPLFAAAGIFALVNTVLAAGLKPPEGWLSAI